MTTEQTLEARAEPDQDDFKETQNSEKHKCAQRHQAIQVQ